MKIQIVEQNHTYSF